MGRYVGREKCMKTTLVDGQVLHYNAIIDVNICVIYRCNDTRFGCIDTSPLLYHNTAIYCTI